MKKILIGIVILGVIVAGIFVYGTFKVADVMEGRAIEYAKLDENAQNKYILDNVTEILTSANADLDGDGKPEDKEQIERLIKANKDPATQQALLEVGRSFMASLVLAYDSISKDMDAAIKAKYEQESKNFDAKFDKYKALIKAAGVKVE